MMTILRPLDRWVLCALMLVLAAVPAAAADLSAVQFPERRATEVRFAGSPGAPDARLAAEVTYRDGQAWIELEFEAMKPAVLYGGDVTCYVVWAVTLSGEAENLGELLVREPKGRLEFATGKKTFALLVTAEPYYLVREPSALVVFRSLPARDKRAPSTDFDFAGLGPAPDHAMKGIAQIAWDSDVPLDLLQARKAYELATRREAKIHAPHVYTEAGEALGKANELDRLSKRGRNLLDLARRSVALSNEAINIAMHRLEAIEIEKQVAKRRAEMAAIEQRAAEAEVAAEAARSSAEVARLEQERLSADIEALRRSKTELESNMRSLQRDKERLATEKVQLRGQLESALSHVAETRETARGFVVNLPDILFDVNEATLRIEARIVLAKLAGIMLIMPDLRATVEGHTDSTGGAEYNLLLSERRAQSVFDFLRAEGIDDTRLRAVGFGLTRPVADNATPEGRAKNRRVEIVIGDTTASAG